MRADQTALGKVAEKAESLVAPSVCQMAVSRVDVMVGMMDWSMAAPSVCQMAVLWVDMMVATRAAQTDLGKVAEKAENLVGKMGG